MQFTLEGYNVKSIRQNQERIKLWYFWAGGLLKVKLKAQNLNEACVWNNSLVYLRTRFFFFAHYQTCSSDSFDNGANRNSCAKYINSFRVVFSFYSSNTQCVTIGLRINLHVRPVSLSTRDATTTSQRTTKAGMPSAVAVAIVATERKLHADLLKRRLISLVLSWGHNIEKTTRILQRSKELRKFSSTCSQLSVLPLVLSSSSTHRVEC